MALAMPPHLRGDMANIRTSQTRTIAKAARVWQTLIHRAAAGRSVDENAAMAAGATLQLGDVAACWEDDLEAVRAIREADDLAEQYRQQHVAACDAEEARTLRLRELEAELLALREQVTGHVSLAFLEAEQQRIAADLRQSHPRVAIPTDATDDAVAAALTPPARQPVVAASSTTPDWV